DVAENVRQRKGHDDVELAEEIVRQPAAEDGESVGRSQIEGDVRRCILLSNKKRIGHVAREDGAHAVERTALGELAPEDEPEPLRMLLEVVDEAGFRWGLARRDAGCLRVNRGIGRWSDFCVVGQGHHRSLCWSPCGNTAYKRNGLERKTQRSRL